MEIIDLKLSHNEISTRKSRWTLNDGHLRRRVTFDKWTSFLKIIRRAKQSSSAMEISTEQAQRLRAAHWNDEASLFLWHIKMNHLKRFGKQSKQNYNWLYAHLATAAAAAININSTHKKRNKKCESKKNEDKIRGDSLNCSHRNVVLFFH